MDPDRNDPCPCGSGLKYKHCCIDRQVWYKNSKVLGIGAALILVLGMLLMVFGSAMGEEQSGPPYERPPGEAPPGQVWSPQHGHWHDAR